jgi:hypothetical protein
MDVTWAVVCFKVEMVAVAVLVEQIVMLEQVEVALVLLLL